MKISRPFQKLLALKWNLSTFELPDLRSKKWVKMLSGFNMANFCLGNHKAHPMSHKCSGSGNPVISNEHLSVIIVLSQCRISEK